MGHEILKSMHRTHTHPLSSKIFLEFCSILFIITIRCLREGDTLEHIHVRKGQNVCGDTFNSPLRVIKYFAIFYIFSCPLWMWNKFSLPHKKTSWYMKSNEMCVWCVDISFIYIIGRFRMNSVGPGQVENTYIYIYIHACIIYNP